MNVQYLGIFIHAPNSCQLWLESLYSGCDYSLRALVKTIVYIPRFI